jgi:hypothetical protein
VLDEPGGHTFDVDAVDGFMHEGRP